MRLVRSSLVALALSSVVGAVAVAGCSASGDSGAPLDGLNTDQDPTEPSEDDASTILSGDDSTDDPDNGDPSGGGTTGKDAGKTSKDAGKTPPTGTDGGGTTVDAGFDAGVVVNPGDACTGAVKFTRACGNCGTQTAFCTATPGADAGAGVVGPYGECSEPDNACAPGTVVEEDCGNCGKVTKTCNNKCQYTSTKCSALPTACAPGSVQWDKGTCDEGSFQSATCDNECKWTAWSAVCSTPTSGNSMTIGAAVGNVVSHVWSLEGTSTKRPNSTTLCPSTGVSTSGPSVAVEVSNPTNKTATLTIFQSKSPTGAEADLVIWAYAGTGLPMTDDAVKACLKPYQDSCYSPVKIGDTVKGTLASNLCGNTTSLIRFASLDGVTIPAGGKILVYSAAYSSTTTTLGDKTFSLNLRTDKLE